MSGSPLMYARAFRCLAYDPGTHVQCRQRPSDGVFCTPHAREFRAEEAAKAATRLARARLVVDDPSAPPVRRWWASIRVRRLVALRRLLLTELARAEGPIAVALPASAPPVLDAEGDRGR